MRSLESQRGGSIIEVVVMSGVMVAMMTGFMSLISHESKNITYLEDKLSRVALESELRMLFSSEGSCQNLFQGFVVPKKGQTVDFSQRITTPLQTTEFEKVFQRRGNDYFYDKLILEKMDFENSTFTAPATSGTVDVMFYPERTRKGGGPDTLQPIKLKTSLTVDASYKITSCSGEDGAGKSCLTSDLDNLYIVPEVVYHSSSTGPEGGHDSSPKTCSQALYLRLNSRTPSTSENKVRHGILIFIQVRWNGFKGGACGSGGHMGGPASVYYSAMDIQAQCDNGHWKWVGGSKYITPGTPEIPSAICSSGYYCH